MSYPTRHLLQLMAYYFELVLLFYTHMCHISDNINIRLNCKCKVYCNSQCNKGQARAQNFLSLILINLVPKVASNCE